MGDIQLEIIMVKPKTQTKAITAMDDATVEKEFRMLAERHHIPMVAQERMSADMKKKVLVSSLQRFSAMAAKPVESFR